MDDVKQYSNVLTESDGRIPVVETVHVVLKRFLSSKYILNAVENKIFQIILSKSETGYDVTVSSRKYSRHLYHYLICVWHYFLQIGKTGNW